MSVMLKVLGMNGLRQILVTKLRSHLKNLCKTFIGRQSFWLFSDLYACNVYAGCLFQKIKEEISDLDFSLSKGNLSQATAWLCENVQVHGSLFEPRATVEKATGAKVTVKPLLNYLEEKYREIYDLGSRSFEVGK